MLPVSDGRKHPFDKLPSAHRAAQPVELGPAFGLHGDGSGHGCPALGVGGFPALRAASAFARAAVGGFRIHIFIIFGDSQSSHFFTTWSIRSAALRVFHSIPFLKQKA